MQQPDDLSLPEELVRKLSRLGGRVRRLAVLKGAGLFALVATAGTAALLLVDLFWELSTAARMGMLAGLAAVLAVACVQWLVRPCLRRVGPAELAALVEQHYPQLRERLTSTVELHDPDIPDAHKGSPLMRELLTKQTLRSVGRIDFAESVPTARATRFALCGAAALLLLVVPFLWSPAGYGLLWSRLLAPWGNFDRGGSLYFEVTGGDRVVARGSDVVIAVEPRWRRSPGELPAPVWLNWTDAAGERDSRRLEYDEAAGGWRTTIPHVFQPFEFNVAAGRQRSRTYRIDVIEPPALLGATLDVQPPAYTGLPAARHDGVIGETPVFERSRMRFELRLNKPVASAELVWLGADGAAEPFTLSDDRQSAALDLTAPVAAPVFEDGAEPPVSPWPAIARPFALRLTDEHGLNNIDEPRRHLLVTPDQPPALTVAGNDEPQTARPDDVLRINATATDDVGLGALELHYEVVDGEPGRIAVAAEQLGGATKLTHEFRLDLAALGLSDGAALTYRVRAADERPVPGPNEVWSQRRIVTVSTSGPPTENPQLAERQQRLQEAMEQLRSDLAESREQAAELHEQAEADLDNEQEFARDEELAALAQGQTDLARRLEELAARFAEQPLFAPLTPEARQMARQELAEAGDALRQAADAPLPEKADALKQNADRLADLDPRMEELQRRLDALAALERDLQELHRLARDAERLAQQARDLDDQRQNPPADETAEERQAREQQLAQNQQRLADRQQELDDQLSDLLQRRPELLEAALRNQLERLADLAQQALDLVEPQERLADALGEEAQWERGEPGEQVAQADPPPGDAPMQNGDSEPAANPPASNPAEPAAGDANEPAPQPQPDAGENAGADPGPPADGPNESPPQAANAPAGPPQNADGQPDQPQDGAPQAPAPQNGEPAGAEPANGMPQAESPQPGEAQNGPPQEAGPQEGQPQPMDPAVAQQAGGQEGQDAGENEPAAGAPEQPAAAEQAGADQAGGENPAAGAEQGGADEPSAAGAQALTQQQQLAQEAAELALDIARQMGPESPATQQAMESARLSGG